MLNLVLDEKEARLVITALANLSRHYKMMAGDAKGYHNRAQKSVIKSGDDAHKLCMSISDQVQKQKEKQEQRESQPPKVDPYDDPDWAINDPRGW